MTFAPKHMYRVGIVGYGKVGMLRAKLVEAHPQLQLDSVCDSRLIASEEAPNCLVYTDFAPVLERNPDIIFVCTPNYLIKDTVVQSLERGCHVFAEKPPGRNVADVQAMRDSEKAHPQLKLKFGFNHRYHDSVLEAYRLVKSGRLGKILSIRGVYGKSGSTDFETQWRNQHKYSGGGILLDQGIHILDLMLQFCGDFTEVKSFVNTLFWNIEVEDNAFAIMRNADMQVGMLLSSATQWKHTFHLEITLEEGYLALRGILSGTRSYGRESLVIARKTYDEGKVGNPEEETYFFETDYSWEREIEEFVRCIENDDPIQIGSSEDALKVMSLVEEIYRSDLHKNCITGDSQ